MPPFIWANGIQRDLILRIRKWWFLLPRIRISLRIGNHLILPNFVQIFLPWNSFFIYPDWLPKSSVLKVFSDWSWLILQVCVLPFVLPDYFYLVVDWFLFQIRHNWLIFWIFLIDSYFSIKSSFDFDLF